MPYCCCVPECKTNSGYRSKKKYGITEKISLFSATYLSEEMFEKWKRKLPREGFSRKHRVCEKHFLDSDILRIRKTSTQNGDSLPDGFIRSRLKPDAVPRIFPNLPAYLSDLKQPRKPPKERPPPVIPSSSSSKENAPQSSNVSNISANSAPTKNSASGTIASPGKRSSSAKCSSNKKQSNFSNRSNRIENVPCIDNVILIDSDPEEVQQYDYVDLLEDLQKMKNELPGWCWGDMSHENGELILCSHIDASTGLLDKYVKVNKTDLSVEGFFTNINQPLSCLPVKKIRNRIDVLKVLKLMTNLKIIFQKKVNDESDTHSVDVIL